MVVIVPLVTLVAALVEEALLDSSLAAGTAGIAFLALLVGQAVFVVRHTLGIARAALAQLVPAPAPAAPAGADAAGRAAGDGALLVRAG